LFGHSQKDLYKVLVLKYRNSDVVATKMNE
jgi:hypothetical protein